MGYIGCFGIPRDVSSHARSIQNPSNILPSNILPSNILNTSHTEKDKNNLRCSFLLELHHLHPPVFHQVIPSRRTMFRQTPRSHLYPPSYPVLEDQASHLPHLLHPDRPSPPKAGRPILVTLDHHQRKPRVFDIHQEILFVSRTTPHSHLSWQYSIIDHVKTFYPISST